MTTSVLEIQVLPQLPLYYSAMQPRRWTLSQGQSYREISHRLGLSKNTVLDIVKRERAA